MHLRRSSTKLSCQAVYISSIDCIASSNPLCWYLLYLEVMQEIKAMKRDDFSGIMYNIWVL